MPEKKKFELTPSVSIIVAGVIVAAAIIYTNAHPGAAAIAADQQVAPAEVHVPAPTSTDHIVGSPQAPIVLVEYSDFQCPFCSIVYPTLKSIVEGSNGQIAWVMRNFPLSSIHPNANPAANAAECIAEQLGNTGWWKFADDIFANQDKMSDSYYAQLAQKYGADMSKFNSCYKVSKYQTKIDQETQEAVQNGGQGTPYTVAYSSSVQLPVSGAQPLANFQAVISAVKARH